MSSSFLRSDSTDIRRIERYTALATPTVPSTSKTEPNAYPSQQRPVSPTSSMKTNASSSTAPVDSSQQYHQFPAQAARIPVTHSREQLENHQGSQANGSPLQHVHSRDASITNANMTSPLLASLAREPSWPVEGFGDLHLSASEPRIFPGIVSRNQRRDSLVKRGSMSETDDFGSVKNSKGGKTRMDGAVEEEDSDGDMEEAGGMDE